MLHSTTILAVRCRDRAVLAGDGQVTFGNTVVKQGARKIRRLYGDRILAGFAGSAADSFALFSRFEAKLEQYRGNLERSAVELAKDWRSDRLLRRLEAMLVVLDREHTFLLSGTGGDSELTINADRLNRALLGGNKIVAGCVNSVREDFEQGVQDLALFERLWPGVAAQLITRRLHGLSEFAQILDKPENDVKTVIEIGGWCDSPRRCQSQ